jgi:hypothetical protein
MRNSSDFEDRDDELRDEPEGSEPKAETRLPYRTAMIAYAAIGVLCLATLHGNALYITLLIVGAIALKTWLARVKSRIE